MGVPLVSSGRAIQGYAKGSRPALAHADTALHELRTARTSRPYYPSRIVQYIPVGILLLLNFRQNKNYDTGSSDRASAISSRLICISI